MKRRKKLKHKNTKKNTERHRKTEKQKYKSTKTKKEFNIVMSGQFGTFANFILLFRTETCEWRGRSVGGHPERGL